MDMSGINEVFKIIAETLGTTVELVQQNSTYYILEYARYSLIKNIGYEVTFWCLISAVISSVLSVVYGFYLLDDTVQEDEFSPSMLVKPFFIIYLLVITVNVVFAIIPYFVSPYMYGVEQILKLMK